jgi:hypothetical protein
MRLASLLNHLSAHLVDLSLAARARLCAPVRAWSWTYRHARRVHPLTAITGIVVLLPLIYLAYCIVTLPGEAVIEPTASALVVQADGGQVIATRGVFKGEKLSAQSFPVTSRTRLSRSKIATSLRTAASICLRYFAPHSAMRWPARRARAAAPSPSSSRA